MDRAENTNEISCDAVTNNEGKKISAKKKKVPKLKTNEKKKNTRGEIRSTKKSIMEQQVRYSTHLIRSWIN